VRDFVSRRSIDTAVIFPGLLSGLLKTGARAIDDGKLVETAKKINRQRARDKRPLSLFMNAHDLVARFMID
jgi:malic enzyme